MELEVKETRLVIVALKRLREQTLEELDRRSEGDDEYAFLSNDAALIDGMISAFEKEYAYKYGQRTPEIHVRSSGERARSGPG